MKFVQGMKVAIKGLYHDTQSLMVGSIFICGILYFCYSLSYFKDILSLSIGHGRSSIRQENCIVGALPWDAMRRGNFGITAIFTSFTNIAKF